MDPPSVVNPPPAPRIFDFPITVGVTVMLIAVAILLVVSGKFDQTQGTLTIMLMITVAFVGALMFSLLFTVPHDEATAAIVGALTLAFGAVVSYVFRRRNGNGNH